MRCHSGDVILWREVWRGRPWLVKPVRVVEDRDDLLAVYLAEGTRLTSSTCGSVQTGRSADRLGEIRVPAAKLTLLSPNQKIQMECAVPGRCSVSTPWPRQRVSSPRSHGCRPGGHGQLPAELKDEELLERWIERGRLSAEEVDAIRAEGVRVVADAVAGRWWWSEDWAAWTPGPAWTNLELPPDGTRPLRLGSDPSSSL